ncbi:MAG: FAD:protein FMN transferase, partial [Pseudomonadota bacterium]
KASNMGLATSGDYRNFFMEDGTRFSHIINPKTGRPVEHATTSVTVLAENAMMADAWATALLAMGASAVVVCGLHLYTGWRDAIELTVDSDWIDVAAITEMIDGRARIVRPAAGEAIAVFRDGDSIAAVSNVCRHQAGPLGEGRIVDGCVTCPWHGFQYRLNDGCSPEPFTERIATYRTRIEAGRVFVNQVPAAPGTPQVPSIIEAN